MQRSTINRVGVAARNLRAIRTMHLKFHNFRADAANQLGIRNAPGGGPSSEQRPGVRLVRRSCVLHIKNIQMQPQAAPPAPPAGLAHACSRVTPGYRIYESRDRDSANYVYETMRLCPRCAHFSPRIWSGLHALAGVVR